MLCGFGANLYFAYGYIFGRPLCWVNTWCVFAALLSSLRPSSDNLEHGRAHLLLL